MDQSTARGTNTPNTFGRPTTQSSTRRLFRRPTTQSPTRPSATQRVTLRPTPRPTTPRPFRPGWHPHLLGWGILFLILLVQPWGQVSTDTKLDLLLNPAGFLRNALHAWTDTLTLGQLQNQAYGYLFPQGTFFVATQFLPDWIAERFWWLIVLGVGYSGIILVLQRLGCSHTWIPILAAFTYVLSPRTLSTLTTISSETWPTMLAPWVVWAFLGPLSWRTVATAVIPVALMGAVNATATMMACLPGGVVLVWRIVHREPRSLRTALGWLTGCALVSAWWIGPLLVLGKYSAPFTDYIESASVTTRWLNPLEILRGTTSWTPFADTERAAGVLLTREPIFILLTGTVAALSLAGLALYRRRGLWIMMLLTGVLILGAAHGVYGAELIDFLDGAGAPLRNLHKCDPLIRIPLTVGCFVLLETLALRGSKSAQELSTSPGEHPLATPPSWLRWNTWSELGKREVLAGLVVLVLIGSLAPAWSGRLLPLGTWTHVPSDWYQAAEFLNSSASGTRTLLYPERSFARDSWGWTRDEPAQPLLDVPWAIRDAIPLIDPEATRGLDGLMAVLDKDPEHATAALASFGIGAILLRAEDKDDEPTSALSELPGERHVFGDLEVILLNASTNLRITSAQPIRIAGGGDVVPLWQSEIAQHPVELVSENAQVVTDTPALVNRNYGTLIGPTSAYLTPSELGDHVNNPVPDYPSVGPLVGITETGARVTASSSADNADSFGGARPSRSVTAAVDKDLNTAWWPAPAPSEGQWLQLSDSFEDAQLRLRVTDIVDATISSDTASVKVRLNPKFTKVIAVPGRKTSTIRITLHGKAGIREVSVIDHPISRVVTIPDTSPNVRQYFFQRWLVDTGNLIRRFTAPRDMEVLLDSPEAVRLDGHTYKPGDTIHLTSGAHTVIADGDWLALTEPAFAKQLAQAGAVPSEESHTSTHAEVSAPIPASGSTPPSTGVTAPLDIHTALSPATQDRLIMTGRSFNEGQQAFLGDTQLIAQRIDSGLQAFQVPQGASGTLRFTFSGETPYQLSLLWGGVLALLTMGGCFWLLGSAQPPVRGRRQGKEAHASLQISPHTSSQVSSDASSHTSSQVPSQVSPHTSSQVSPHTSSQVSSQASSQAKTVECASTATVMENTAEDTAVNSDSSSESPVLSFLGYTGTTGVLTLVGGIAGGASVLVAWALRRFTLIPVWASTAVPVLIATMWLSRSPWPDVGHVYGGDVYMLGWLVLLGMAAAQGASSLATPRDSSGAAPQDNPPATPQNNPPAAPQGSSPVRPQDS